MSVPRAFLASESALFQAHRSCMIDAKKLEGLGWAFTARLRLLAKRGWFCGALHRPCIDNHLKIKSTVKENGFV